MIYPTLLQGFGKPQNMGMSHVRVMLYLRESCWSFVEKSPLPGSLDAFFPHHGLRYRFQAGPNKAGNPLK